MKSRVICWDTSVMIDYIRGNKSRNPDRLPQIEAVMNSVECGNYKIIVSSLLYVEILGRKNHPRVMETFNQLMKKINLIRDIGVSTNIAKRAQIIRNRFSQLETPDAIHIATAVISQAIVFHTYDEYLLRLNGRNELDGLKITPCRLPEETETLI